MKAGVLQKTMKYGAEMIASLVAGALGGWVFGFIILSFCDLIGRSGNSEPLQPWNSYFSFVLASFYGMPLGLFIFPVGYFLFLRNVSLPQALAVSSAGTLLGGLIGAAMGPPAAAVFGVIGFFLSSAFIGNRS
jgi:hypothetical protein